MNILITICARGGSKGIPGKNIKLINSKPLIYYTLKIAEVFKKESENNVDIFLSTDSQKIKHTVNKLNFDLDLSYDRPAVLATDKSGKIDAINDVKQFAENQNRIAYDYVLDLDVTSPLRTLDDLNIAFEILQNNKLAYNIFSVNLANRNPYFNIVEEQKDGYFKTSKDGLFLSRQSAPKVYDMNASFYFYKKAFFDEGFKSAITDKSLIFEMDHICFDLDHPIDFDFMEYLLKENRLDFNFVK
jgi:N-acylneuraminate cytidylyltransferase/CMP-N,N'-diacetyllegionaminic acid synthase